MTTIERLRGLERAAKEKPGGICFSTIQELELAQAARNALPSMLAVIEAAEAVLDDPCYSEMYQGERDKLRAALAAFREVRE